MIKRQIYFTVTLILLLALSHSGGLSAADKEADGLTVASVFGDHMVLQRHEKVAVWGTAPASETVTVDFRSKKYHARATEQGRWKVMLDAADAGGPYFMTVSIASQQLRFEDVFIGDVWLASGQSNMAYRFRAAVDPDKAAVIASVNDFNIRTYEVAKVVGGGKLLEEEDRPWARVSPDNVDEWSAVAFYFARGLYKHLNVPIGIINCNQGGSTIEAWMSDDALKGTNVPEESFNGMFSHYKNRSTLYHTMLSGIIPYTLKGVLWYQGESNAHAPEHYDDLLAAMIKQWRHEWADDSLPFLLAQLPDFTRKEDETRESWARLRQAQEEVALTVPHTAMVVLIDAGDKNDIHPRNKRVVGERFVLAARALVYGEKVDYSGPMVRKVKYQGKRAVVSYSNAEEGLIIKGDGISAFDVRDTDGTWHAATARRIKDRIEVTHDGVNEVVGVRYAWTNAPDVNLFDKSGLPAAPFEKLKKDSRLNK